jgi:hypothetical protein
MRDRILNWLALYSISGGGVQQAGTQGRFEEEACKLQLQAAANNGPVHLAYNSSYSACFFSRNNIFLSKKISQQCFSADL